MYKLREQSETATTGQNTVKLLVCELIMIYPHYDNLSSVCNLAPPDITETSVEFSCNASLAKFPVKISWIVSIWSSFTLIYILCPQPGARSKGVVYPGEVMVDVELHPLLDYDIACSIETDTSCTTIITREIYTVTVNQTNDFGSTVNLSSFDGIAMHSCYTLSRLNYLTAKILVVTEEILSSDAEPLRVTVSVNELCQSDRDDYLVIVTFGTWPLAGGGGDDCVGQVNGTVVIIILSPHSLWQLTLLV